LARFGSGFGDAVAQGAGARVLLPRRSIGGRALEDSDASTRDGRASAECGALPRGCNQGLDVKVAIGDVEAVRDGVFRQAASVLAFDLDGHFVDPPKLRREFMAAVISRSLLPRISIQAEGVPAPWWTNAALARNGGDQG